MSADAPHISVVGGGSWATALVKIITDNKIPVRWWMRDEDNIAHIREHQRNSKYLRAARLDTQYITMSTDLRATVRGTEVMIVATPAAFLAESLRPLTIEDVQSTSLVSAVKGMEPSVQLSISRWLMQRFSATEERLAVISGPCHAEEAAEDQPAYLTVGAEFPALGEMIAHALKRPHIRTSVLPDTVGIEYAAVLKNIYAIAAGIAAGLGYGDNFRAVLVSSAAREMRAFLDQHAPRTRDILHSVYIGDLLVTAYSQHSRNRTFGLMVGNGYHVRTAQLEMKMIAEGYYASQSIWAVCRKHNISLPIADAVYRVLYEKVAPKLEFGLLMDKLG